MMFDVSFAQRGATVILNLAVAVAVGAAATRLWTAGMTSPWSQLQGGRARRTGIGALAVAIVASVCTLWLEAASMAEVPPTQAGAETWTMLTATHLGTAWQIGAAALVVSLVAMLRHYGKSWTRASLAAIALFLYSRSMVSHASAGGDFSLMMIVDWVHLLLISLWVGEVVVSGLVVLPSLPGELPANRGDCSRYVESLSTSATVALVGIFATGLVNAWYSLGNVNALTATPYGTTLLVKLALVMGAALLGGMNRFMVMPGLVAALRAGGAVAETPARRFTMILRAEALVLLAVLVMAAILSSISPPTAG
jgi:putative copper resistance protein D